MSVFAQSPAGTPAAPADPAWAWAQYEPSAERPWTLPLAAHLYRRAGFGATWDQLQRAMADGPQRSVDRLLRPEADVDAFNRTYDQYDRAAARSGSVDGLRAWWLRRMIETPHPLVEKMTLFWHSHFAASNARVKSAALMADHLAMLRRHALGKYRLLLEAASRDPAMFLGLDAVANRKAMPNENFVRQLIEQLTLGPGHFDERDVREAARAFTGWFVRRGQLTFVAREHDEGAKTILGQTGPFTVDDVVSIVLQQPTVSRTLVRKLYAWLISEVETPGDTLIGPLVETLDQDYDVGGVVEKMLRSNLFFSPASYRRRIKSPVEYALGIIRPLEGTVPTIALAHDLSGLGQNLLYPPTVRGWHGGRYWINRTTLVARSNLAFALLATTGPYSKKLDPVAVAAGHGFRTPASAADFLLDLFLQQDVDSPVRSTLKRRVSASGGARFEAIRAIARAVVTSPEFQLC